MSNMTKTVTRSIANRTGQLTQQWVHRGPKRAAVMGRQNVMR